MGLQARPRLIQLRPSSRSASQHHPDGQLTSSKLRTELVWVTKTLLPATLISISKFHPDSLAQSINLILRVNYLEDLIQSEHGSSKSTSYHTLGAHMNPRAHPRPEGRRTASKTSYRAADHGLLKLSSYIRSLRTAARS